MDGNILTKLGDVVGTPPGKLRFSEPRKHHFSHSGINFVE